MMKCSGLLMMFTVIAPCFHQLANAASNESSVQAEFTGTLTENIQPCTIRPGDDEISLAFSSVEMKSLKEQKRTKGYPFSIHLDNCDTTEPRTVTISFTGPESSDSAGLLMPDRSSITDGIAIGIETTEGQLLAINDPTKSLSLQLEESTVFALQAFIQVVDENKLAEGNFHASANYILEYD